VFISRGLSRHIANLGSVKIITMITQMQQFWLNVSQKLLILESMLVLTS
jgi:hypothetical protein